jgi:hypothetical protein
VLKQGEVYTRQQLRERFGIADKTMDTGIFKPSGQDSVWLFVTEQKPIDMTAYVDRLDGDTLHWQGQTAGLKDAQIIEHAERDLELVVFYRPRKDYYSGYGFRFEGAFVYVSHSGSNPTSFVLRRDTAVVTAATGADASPTLLPEAGDLCLVDVLTSLRQSGRDSVVAEGRVTQMQERMHVPDQIEDWVARRVASWRAEGSTVPLLIVLSGNAGDGKSDLIERLRARPEVAGDDLDVIADATHAESPSQSQAERLVRGLGLFTTEPPLETSPRCLLVAMNVGMVIAFFDALRGGPDEERFLLLRTVLEGRLGLTRATAEPPDHWTCEVINLDNRNVLGRNSDGLVAGMLRKLDPEQPGSLTFDAAQACTTCPVRGCCWIRTNLNLLRVPAVREAIHGLLWEVTLGSDLHLSPRNVWDMFSQATTGGVELPETNSAFLSCQWMREHLPGTPQELRGDQIALVHRRLIYHLLFEPSHPAVPDRGPVFEALAATDPIRRGKKHTHLIEGEVRAAPRADSERLSTLALLADEPAGDGRRRQDPLLDGLASLVTDPVLWFEQDANLRDLALGVSRRARLTGLPAEVQTEVTDDDTSRFLELLQSYASWHPEQDPPAPVERFWSAELVAGIREMFGEEVQGETYFRLDTLSPATQFPAYVPVKLRERLSIKPDPVLARGGDWLEAVAYLPRRVVATVDTGGQEPWDVPVDLQLYRLLSYVNRGYSASSVDLEGFFRLRYACERLGASDPSAEIVFRANSDGRALRLRREAQLGGREKTVFGPVEATS